MMLNSKASPVLFLALAALSAQAGETNLCKSESAHLQRHLQIAQSRVEEQRNQIASLTPVQNRAHRALRTSQFLMIAGAGSLGVAGAGSAITLTGALIDSAGSSALGNFVMMIGMGTTVYGTPGVLVAGSAAAGAEAAGQGTLPGKEVQPEPRKAVQIGIEELRRNLGRVSTSVDKDLQLFYARDAKITAKEQEIERNSPHRFWDLGTNDVKYVDAMVDAASEREENFQAEADYLDSALKLVQSVCAEQ